jgi:integrase
MMKARKKFRVFFFLQWMSPKSRILTVRLSMVRIPPADGIVFPGIKPGEALSNGSMLRVLDRMGRGDLTFHGFRATFKTWASERTNFAREVIEAALAHAISDKVEAAYRRDFFEKRKRLMTAWAEFCARAAPEMGRLLHLKARA